MPGRVQGTNAFVHKQDIQKNRQKDVTYGCIIYYYQPGKAEPNRARLTIRGDRINYPDDCGTQTADVLTIKLMFNSIIMTKGT